MINIRRLHRNKAVIKQGAEGKKKNVKVRVWPQRLPGAGCPELSARYRCSVPGARLRSLAPTDPLLYR